MKKLVMTVAVLTCAASFVSAETVTSANVVGFNKITLDPGFSMVRTAFNEGGQAVELQEIFDTSGLLQGATFAAADQILFWDEVNLQYDAYYLHDGSGKTGAGKGGKWVEKATSAIATNLVLPEQSFFFTRNGATSVEVVTSGEVVVADTGTNSIAVTDGFNMIASPFSSEWKLNDGSLDWIAQGAVAGSTFAAADQIQFWNLASLQYDAYFLHDGSGKTGAGKGGKWVDKETSTVDANLSVGIGEGFFYARQQGAGAMIIDVDQPYDLD